ncbi:uncharacterized protein LOC129981771 isoform X2 [Argiope bruennichi]|uniref:uncharacterized protein LOC129981771 isoform X2 n=1 Tax=Argiope bruennichi TaxID=94029 RepID=UPI0024949445|nr:uncharacterized protein LOC129981771 isoform X2 [Argiope bruennichi]
MSRQLVRKAFDLLEDEIKSGNANSKSKKKSSTVSENSIKKQKMLNSKEKKNKKFKKMKSPIDTYKEKHMVDRTEENLQILLKLKSLKPKPSTAQKILDFHQKQLTKRLIEPEVEIQEPESILFPEENEKRKKKKKKEM